MVKRVSLLETIYNLFEPISRSKAQFKKKLIFVSDTHDILQPMASPVSIANARRALGIKSERIAGRPAWHAPVFTLNHAVFYGSNSLAMERDIRQKRALRLGAKLATHLRSYIADNGLAVPYYTAMQNLRQWRIEMQVGRGFSYTGFSQAVRILRLEKKIYQNTKYYVLKWDSTRDSGYDRAFEELTEFVEEMFVTRRSIKEKEILAAAQAEGYHPVATLEVEGFRKSNGWWHAEGEKGVRVYTIKKPF